VELTPKEAKAQRFALQWGKAVKDKVVKKMVMNDKVTSGRITKNRGAHKRLQRMKSNENVSSYEPRPSTEVHDIYWCLLSM
jgi:hypothetical protein